MHGTCDDSIGKEPRHPVPALQSQHILSDLLDLSRRSEPRLELKNWLLYTQAFCGHILVKSLCAGQGPPVRESAPGSMAKRVSLGRGVADSSSQSLGLELRAARASAFEGTSKIFRSLELLRARAEKAPPKSRKLLTEMPQTLPKQRAPLQFEHQTPRHKAIKISRPKPRTLGPLLRRHPSRKGGRVRPGGHLAFRPWGSSYIVPKTWDVYYLRYQVPGTA